MARRGERRDTSQKMIPRTRTRMRNGWKTSITINENNDAKWDEEDGENEELRQ